MSHSERQVLKHAFDIVFAFDEAAATLLVGREVLHPSSQLQDCVLGRKLGCAVWEDVPCWIRRHA